MKKVIGHDDCLNTVDIDKVSQKKYYGVVNCRGDKGFIIKPIHGLEDYRIICVDWMNLGNYFLNTTNCPTLIALINSAMRLNFDVYEFETYQALLQWLLQD